MPNVTKKKNHFLAQTVQVSRRVPPPPPVGRFRFKQSPPNRFPIRDDGWWQEAQTYWSSLPMAITLQSSFR